MNLINTELALWFNRLAGRSEVFDRLAIVLEDQGEVLVAGVSIAAFLLVAEEQHHFRRSLFLAGSAGLVALIGNNVLEWLVHVDRPFVVLAEIRPIVEHVADNSFPSDHVTGMAALAFGIFRTRATLVRWVFAGLTLGLGVHRLYTGMHWFSDIAASMLLAWVTVQLVFWAAQPLYPWLDRWIARLDWLGLRPRRKQPCGRGVR